MLVKIVFALSACASIGAQDYTPQSACLAIADCRTKYLELEEPCMALRPQSPSPSPNAIKISPELQDRITVLVKQLQRNEIQCWSKASNATIWCSDSQKTRCQKAVSDYNSGTEVQLPMPPPGAWPPGMSPPPASPHPPATVAPLSPAEIEFRECLAKASRQSHRCSALSGCCPEMTPCMFETQASPENIERYKIEAELVRQTASVCPAEPPPHPTSPPANPAAPAQ